LLKEDRQAFGLLISKAETLEEAFKYPLTTVALSIAESSTTLRQGDKAGFRNFLIHNSDAAVSNFIPGATWIFDGIAIMRSIKPKSTFGEFFDSFLKLLSLNENKTDLIKCFVEYLKSKPLAYFNLDIPITITEEENTIRIDHSGWSYLAICNHEEADSRMPLHAANCNSDCVIVSKDTDVFLLLIYDNEKFVNIGNVFTYLGIHMTENILKFHSLTGCDTTLYFFRVGKIKVWKKLLKSPAKINLINSLGLTKDLSINDEQNCQKFIQTVMYNGTEEEEYIATRVRLYKKQSTKTSIALPPDPDSCKQAIKRAHFQSYYWNNCLQSEIEPINVEENGWCIKDKIYPLWYTGPQLPPSCSKKKKTSKSAKVTNYEGDNDSDTSLNIPPRKRAKRCTKDAIKSKSKNEWKKLLKESRENPGSESDDYDADIDSISVTVESDNIFSESDEWEHYSAFEDDSDDDSSDSDWIM